ncbi:MAG: hypothetical protein ACLQAT_21380 [Candidatus Binataceae bacterium]
MSDVATIGTSASWLETIDADSPLLLIAPHGGRAGQAARAMLHPKVNDLRTAEITRELAERLGASALINSAMDRNQIDCNRIPQIAEHAPWMLEIIANRLAAIIDRHGHATVLLIHGWNIIEPRIDFGLGLRTQGRELRPPGSAHVSASDEFINGPLANLAARLGAAGIKTTFGMRYPAGGVHNLVQAFTGRHRESAIPALGRISAIAAQGLVNTAQLELSVSVRLPGVIRERCVDAISASFSGEEHAGAPGPSHFSIVRMPRAVPRPASVTAPLRVGVEFYDPSSRIGAMASFDLGNPGFGARIMMIVGERRVVLCTCEGHTRREANKLSLGPLSLSIDGGNLVLNFEGPAVVVPDGSTYLSIERALATGHLDAGARISVQMPIAGSGFDPAVLFGEAVADSAQRGSTSFFSVASGHATIESATLPLHASARAGISFTGLGPQRFRQRRMIWALFDDDRADPRAIEVRRVDDDGGPSHQSARAFSGETWSVLNLDRLEIEYSSVDVSPHRLEASANAPGGAALGLIGNANAFVPLSRPGPDGSRIYTSMGFGTFRSGERSASGMFEYSRRVDAASDDDAEGDTD